jgi:uncharacterized protein YjgD (DUF1641 family)
MGNDLVSLHQKIDYLTEQINVQRRRQDEFDELKRDLLPIANHMLKLTIDELSEIGTDFELEDVLFLLKRLLRDTRRMTLLLDRLEAGMDLVDEFQLLGRQIFSDSVEMLDRMEREGYFDFVRGGWYILERIVSEFDEGDVRALGDNIVTILTTMRNMTQPEVLALANNAIGSIQGSDPGNGKAPSTFALLLELTDPKVRKGLARMLNIVKALADQPEKKSLN